MIDGWLHPGLILIFGAVLLPLIPVSIRKPFALLVPVLAFARVFMLQDGSFGTLEYFGMELVFGRVDALSTVFGYILALMSLLGTLYALNTDGARHIAVAWIYAGAALGAVFAGDYLTLFLFWEMMAFASAFLIFMRGRPESIRSGYRYLLVHAFGGVVLLAGLIMHANTPGNSWEFAALDVANPTPAMYLILIGILLNAAVPPLHAWLPDAYGEATVSGAVFLCAFTTKTAVYALCRGFAGMELLIWLGVAMALYGVVYAVLENDSRRLLAYHIISQVGYMVAGVGIGTQLAINGVCAHAFAHILYKGLLFMGCGAVLHMTGQSKFTELGGLYKKMPWTFLFTLIGGLSISAFPLFSGFVSKSMIVAAGFDEHVLWAAYLLMLASVGTFLHTGLKVPYFIWFGKNNCSEQTWQRAEDPPWNMMAAMAITAVLCIFIGSYTPWLYGMLPYMSDYRPYTAYHVSESLLLLLFTAVGFFLLLRQLEPKAQTNLDLDFFYRRGGRWFVRLVAGPLQALDAWLSERYRRSGLRGLMASARQTAGFDQRVVDGAVDGMADGIGLLGQRLRAFQRGAVQDNLMLAFVCLLLIAVPIVLIAFFTLYIF